MSLWFCYTILFFFLHFILYNSFFFLFNVFRGDLFISTLHYAFMFTSDPVMCDHILFTWCHMFWMSIHMHFQASHGKISCFSQENTIVWNIWLCFHEEQVFFPCDMGIIHVEKILKPVRCSDCWFAVWQFIINPILFTQKLTVAHCISVFH